MSEIPCSSVPSIVNNENTFGCHNQLKPKKMLHRLCGYSWGLVTSIWCLRCWFSCGDHCKGFLQLLIGALWWSVPLEAIWHVPKLYISVNIYAPPFPTFINVLKFLSGCAKHCMFPGIIDNTVMRCALTQACVALGNSVYHVQV
jgi:hypothetical protein